MELKQYETVLDVVTNVSRFIDEICNIERVHSRINHLTPNEIEDLVKSGRHNKQLPTSSTALEIIALAHNAGLAICNFQSPFAFGRQTRM